MTAASLPASFSIELPSGWVAAPLDGEAWLDDLGAANGTRADELRPFLTALLEASHQDGVVFAATYVDVLPAVEPPEDGLAIVDDSGFVDLDAVPKCLVLATMTLATIPTVEPLGEGRRPIEEVLVALRPAASAVQLSEPVEVELACGEAVELELLEAYDVAGLREPVRFYRDGFYVPVADGAGLAVLSFGTPCLGLVDQFRPVFHAVANALVFVT